jgi:hypothetical protein
MYKLRVLAQLTSRSDAETRCDVLSAESAQKCAALLAGSILHEVPRFVLHISARLSGISGC